jgi:beta-glucosidase/6-phospho-beta-glucosidase/beta-galactosidase
MDSNQDTPSDSREPFIYGVSTSAYQIEGYPLEDGRSPSIWDIFSHIPGKVTKNQNGDDATEHYRYYKEDIKLMKELGIRHYRFSLSWTRILPTGRTDNVNKKGVKYYNDLINELLKNDITPYVTLYHWDFPYSLYKEYGGWTDKKSIEDFVAYSSLCFELFGDRVKFWVTINEPWCVAVLGYCTGEHAPGHSSSPGEDPYAVGHNLLLAHGKTVHIFRESYTGKIGMALNTNWWEPITDSEKDIESTKISLLFSLRWFADPLYFGDYPKKLKDIVGERLLKFSDEEKAMLKGSTEYFGLNHYTTMFTGENTRSRFLTNIRGILDMTSTGQKGMGLIWNVLTKSSHYYGDVNIMVFPRKDMEHTDLNWIIYPRGFKKVLEYCQKKYNPPGGIYVLENGCGYKETRFNDGVEDDRRIRYIEAYINEMKKAMENGVDVRGYFLWSLLDNFEWAHGYDIRFGIVRVDYTTQKRIPKKSATWYSNLCRGTLETIEKNL